MSNKRRTRQKRQLLKRDGWVVKLFGTVYTFANCMWCHCVLPGPRLTIEHIIPKHQGGTDDMENLGLACPPCNHGRNPHYHTPVPPPNSTKGWKRNETKSAAETLPPNKDEEKT